MKTALSDRLIRGIGVAVASLFLIVGLALGANGLLGPASPVASPEATSAAETPDAEATEATAEPTESPDATEAPDADESPEASESPEARDDHGDD